MILSDNETKLDLLNNQAIAKTIVSIIQDSKESLSIGVHGDWGAGKSSILAMVEELLNPQKTEDELDSDDDFDWEDWDEDDPDDAAEDEKGLSASGYITVRFNSWRYQGFEDAKIALMSAIVKALQKEAKAFYKKHPVKGALKKIKDTCKNIWKNIDKLGIAKSIGKVGVSITTGTAPIALLDIAANYAKDIFIDETKRNEFITTAGTLLNHTTTESSSYKEMTEFRANYKELYKAAHIEKLVVLIDDLDRCLPRVAIETLEAVRMFLSMENTAFIIAADDGMIKYSVKEYFPRVLEKEEDESVGTMNYSDFSDKYLEKLIQIPLHIPRIGVQEAQLYVLMLLIESEVGHESKEMKSLAKVVIERLSKPWALEQLSTEEIQKILGTSYDGTVDKIRIAKNIDQFLAEHTGGNPRNIKRFVNMLLLRTAVARNRGFDENDLEMAVLAKMMLIEQYHDDFYKAIAEELREDGSCAAFDIISEPDEKADKDDAKVQKTMKGDKGTEKGQKEESERQALEEAVPVTPEYNNPQFGQMLAQDAIKKWMESEPALAGKDLRPYFFACTEQEDFFFSTQDERLRELIFAVQNGKFTTGSRTEWIKQLENDDALYIFKRITAEIFKRNLKDQKAPKIIEGRRVFVLNRPELQSALADFLLTLPGDKLGVWATGGWDDCIPKTSEARSTLNEYFKKICDQTKDPIVKRAAESALR